MSLKIINCNLRCLASSIKRWQIYYFLKDKKVNIMFIQERNIETNGWTNSFSQLAFKCTRCIMISKFVDLKIDLVKREVIIPGRLQKLVIDTKS